ncbi:ATP-binding protein [Streptomyces sp. CNQ085]|uniref:ATP-binding protein n=1 Tax=Streptomyces sp. CNQ085 TaxID=2886944 RepID=UPI001F505D5F|nr:ATP-binding protein [Streptomyces sp. CNQ085]MCI0383795.1 ATP-binding protein [Streptomyces sp. CNQ085]
MVDNRAGRRPVVTELRLSAFRAHRGMRLPLEPLTLLTGASGSGKSTVLEAYEALARLAGGESVGEVFGGAHGGPAACVPRGTPPDGQGGRGFRLGCTVDGPAGPVRLDLAVQAEPELRVTGERLTGADGRTLLVTALRDPARRVMRAEWRTGGVGQVARAPLPDDRLATVLLPLRVAGATEGQRQVLAAAEQVVPALRSAFVCDPRPEAMREPVASVDALLRGGCDNLAAVLGRLRAECRTRYAALLDAVRPGFGRPVAGLPTEPVAEPVAEPAAGPVAVRGRTRLVGALVEHGDGLEPTPLDRLGDGELRYLALALVLLAGPGVLRAGPERQAPDSRHALVVLADGFDRGMDARQRRELTGLAARMCERGHLRLLGTVCDGTAAGGAVGEAAGARVVDLGG